jgi:hypothetical protein
VRRIVIALADLDDDDDAGLAALVERARKLVKARGD